MDGDGYSTNRAAMISRTAEGDFSCLVEGPVSGPLALCLHGFPDTPATWRHLSTALTREGWRVVCPYLRGFGTNRLNDDTAAGPGALGIDTNALHHALGGDERAIIIGHDWGAAAAYAAAEAAPERWSYVVAASWPPKPDNVDTATFDQMRRSWYVFLFQLPIASALVGNATFIARLWQAWSPNFDGAKYARAAADAIESAGGGLLMLEHYRTLFRDDEPALELTTCPTLYIHGAEDGCIGCDLVADLDAKLAAGSRVLVLPSVGHFPQLEAPRDFNAAILDFLGKVHGRIHVG